MLLKVLCEEFKTINAFMSTTLLCHTCMYVMCTLLLYCTRNHLTNCVNVIVYMYLIVNGTTAVDRDHGVSPESLTSLTPEKKWQSLENLTDPLDADPDLYIAKHDYITDQPGQLGVRKGDQLKVSRHSENGDWVEGTNNKGVVGWLPASYIAQVDSLEKHSWFFGNVTRAEAELSLSSGINGSFLIRESESKPGQYSISLRYDGRVFHYRIHIDPSTGQYYVTPESKFETLGELVKHHSKNPDGLTTTLHYPAPNPRKPPVYSVSHDFDEGAFDKANLEKDPKQYGEVDQAVTKRREDIQGIFLTLSMFFLCPKAPANDSGQTLGKPAKNGRVSASSSPQTVWSDHKCPPMHSFSNFLHVCVFLASFEGF